MPSGTRVALLTLHFVMFIRTYSFFGISSSFYSCCAKDSLFIFTLYFWAPRKFNIRIEVGIPNLDGEIKPNLTAKLRLNDYSNSNAILIPQSIISENAKGQQFIYVVKDNKEKNQVYAERLVIETGKTNGDFIEVTKNLDANVEVILEGARSVNNGQVVKVIKKIN